MQVETFTDIEVNNYAVSFISGHFNVREKPDSCLWCLDRNCQLCVIVLPEPSLNLIDSIVTKYSQNHQVATTIGCGDLNTENPAFMPVAMSMEICNHLFIPLLESIKNEQTPPNESTKTFLENIHFITQDTSREDVRLRRLANNLEKGDLFSRYKNGKRIEIYVTYLPKAERPYSKKELYKFKLKHLFKL